MAAVQPDENAEMSFSRGSDRARHKMPQAITISLTIFITGPFAAVPSPYPEFLMKAIQVQKTGGPEALTLADLPIPRPKPNEAVVKIAAIGVNFIDVYFREGRYPSSLPLLDGQE